MVFAHILNICQQVQHHSEEVHKGRWTNNKDFCFWDTPLIELRDKKIGLVGLGNTGYTTARVAIGFGMQVYALTSKSHFQLPPEIKKMDLDQLFSECDIISLHCPLTAETRHIINADTIKMMRDNAILVNTSRGGLIDTNALIDALRARKFAGVGLDVYEDEDGQVFEDFSDDVLQNEVVPILMSFPNVVVTSHQAFFTRTALQSIAITTMENARAFARGEKLVNEVKG